MAIEFICSACGKKTRAPDNLAGKQVRCPYCKDIINVPASIYEAEETSAPPTPPPPSFKLPAAFDAPASYSPQPPIGGEESRQPCPVCGEMILSSAAKCRFCGEFVEALQRRQPTTADDSVGRTCSIISIICGGISFVCCPPLFGLIGLVLGIIGTVQSKDKTLGVMGIVISILGTIVGMIIGFILLAMNDPNFKM